MLLRNIKTTPVCVDGVIYISVQSAGIANQWIASVDQAETAFAAPLAARDDLRGLLGAYATRAARNGLAEDAGLTERYRPAHESLWQAPCDVDAAAPLVEDYLRAVRRAVGADASDISARAVDASAPQGKEDIS